MSWSLKIPEVQIDSVKAALVGIGGGMPYAISMGQNSTAYIVRQAEQNQMQADLDRPTPWALRSLTYTKSNVKTGAKARVYFEDRFGGNPGEDDKGYLGVQIFGGIRTRRRRSEKILSYQGRLPAGWTWVPDKSVNLNAYGNVPGGVISAAIGGYEGNTLSKYIYLEAEDKRWRGIFRVDGSGLTPILWLIPPPNYTKRLRFYERAQQEIDFHLISETEKAIDVMLAKYK
jgi:hypothetical protein